MASSLNKHLLTVLPDAFCKCSFCQRLMRTLANQHKLLALYPETYPNLETLQRDTRDVYENANGFCVDCAKFTPN